MAEIEKNLEWESLGFNYYRTEWNARFYYRDGAWSEMELSDSEYFPMHISAACLHYGLEIFEGLKAFRGIDGRIRMFRPEENAARMQSSAAKLCLPAPTTEMFVNACAEIVRRNPDFVPPYGTGASLYLRPLLIGTNPVLGVKPATEATFIVFASPVGAYFREGLRPISAVIDRDQDRAAPRGTGDVKVGGNYASSILSGSRAHGLGHSNVLYLDTHERKYIEEFGAANFFAVRGNTYITPKSNSILPSITNKSLRELAPTLGLEVEERPVSIEELESFDEVGACGTAAVISPVTKLIDIQTGRIYSYGDHIGRYSQKMFDALQDIQYGRVEDKFGWMVDVE
ncbi:MAG: branched-chain amino acid aminotransferase [Alistipes sp.]|nr:branched-chain amino acid aminotransferase [Alistipes sp.]